MKKYTYLLAGLLAFCFLGNAIAATVQFDTPNPIRVALGQTFTLTLEGKGFTTPAEGAGFTFNWASSVIQYIGTNVLASPWDTRFVNDTDALADISNKVDSVFIATSDAAQGPDFKIAEISFRVIGNAGDSSIIAFEDIFGGWATRGAAPIQGVQYVNAEVQVVPLPAALYFFVSGILGLYCAKRRS